jgi:hypothetical protein
METLEITMQSIAQRLRCQLYGYAIDSYRVGLDSSVPMRVHFGFGSNRLVIIATCTSMCNMHQKCQSLIFFFKQNAG